MKNETINIGSDLWNSLKVEILEKIKLSLTNGKNKGYYHIVYQSVPHITPFFIENWVLKSWEIIIHQNENGFYTIIWEYKR